MRLASYRPRLPYYTPVQNVSGQVALRMREFDAGVARRLNWWRRWRGANIEALGEERVLGFGATVAPQARACLSANTMTTKNHEVPQELLSSLLAQKKLDPCRMGAHRYNF